VSLEPGVTATPAAASPSQSAPPREATESRRARRAARSVRRRRWWHEWPLLLVLGTGGAGLAIVASDHFKRGTGLFGLALVLATVLRAALPDERAGLLQVRSKTVDLLTLGTLAVATLTLVVLVPPPTA
jgi:hypothetical protein